MATRGRLSRIEVDGLFGRHSVDLNLDPSSAGAGQRLSIVFDDNGRGKTTVLKAVHHLLSWMDLDVHLAALAELPLDSLRLSLGSKFVEFRRDESDPRSCEVAIVSGKSRTALQFDPARDDPRAPTRLILDRRKAAKYRDAISKLCSPPILVSDDRIIHGDDLLRVNRPYAGRMPPTEQRRSAMRDVSRHDRRDPSEELRQLLSALGQTFLQAAFSIRSSARIDAVYADMVRRIAENQVKDAVGDVEALRLRAQNIEESLELVVKYGFMSLSQLQQVEETLAGLRRNSRNKKTIETVLEPFFSTLEADAEKIGPIAARVDLFVSTANSYLKDKSLEFSPGSGLRIVPDILADEEDGEEPLDPVQLSSGERHLLLLLGSSMMAGDDQLILIDEPELSLGIAWKRQLLGSLLALTSESEAQFLVASHSVEIITPFRDSAIPLRQS